MAAKKKSVLAQRVNELEDAVTRLFTGEAAGPEDKKRRKAKRKAAKANPVKAASKAGKKAKKAAKKAKKATKKVARKAKRKARRGELPAIREGRASLGRPALLLVRTLSYAIAQILQGISCVIRRFCLQPGWPHCCAAPAVRRRSRLSAAAALTAAHPTPAAPTPSSRANISSGIVINRDKTADAELSSGRN